MVNNSTNINKTINHLSPEQTDFYFLLEKTNKYYISRTIIMYRWCSVTEQYFLNWMIICIASIQMSLKYRIPLILKICFLPWPSPWQRRKIKKKKKLYDKRDYLTFPTVNFPLIGSNIPASPAYAVYISQLTRYYTACIQWFSGKTSAADVIATQARLRCS